MPLIVLPRGHRFPLSDATEIENAVSEKLKNQNTLRKPILNFLLLTQ
jgi:hypothetical protein